MKINHALVSRSLIALLFVVAGTQKLINFSQTSAFIGSLNIPLPTLATLIVIFIEVPVALMFAWGYKVRQNGYILVAFTILVTLVVHTHYFTSDLVNVLKNLAIVGGIMSAVRAACKDCVVHHKNKHEHH